MRGPSKRSDVAPFRVMDVLKAAAVRQAERGDVINLAAGQPSTGAPKAALDAVEQAMRNGPLGYTETAGVLPLRQAIAALHTRRYGYRVDPEQVVVASGSSGAFTALFLAAFDPGDTVAMASPGYPPYRNTLRALGLDVLELACGPEVRYQPTVEMLEALPEPPAGLIVASPANPTGTVIEPARLAELARWCEENDCLLLSDEIYHGLSYGDLECASAWQTSTQAVVMGSFSKYFSMTGWRIGWMLLPPHLVRPVDLLLGNMAICPPAIAQVAGIAALGDQAAVELDGHVERYARNRQVLLRRLPELGIERFAPPDGAFYVYCDVSHLTDDSLAWCARVMDQTGVSITPGLDFDTLLGNRYIRVSFAGASGELDEAFDRLSRIIP